MASRIPRLPKLAWKTALDWLHEDSRDDFFPDPIRHIDYSAKADEYLERNRRKLPQYSREPVQKARVPKLGFLNRDAVLLAPPFRIVYLALFADMYPAIAPQLESGVFSYRLAHSGIRLFAAILLRRATPLPPGFSFGMNSGTRFSSQMDNGASSQTYRLSMSTSALTTWSTASRA